MKRIVVIILFSLFILASCQSEIKEEGEFNLFSSGFLAVKSNEKWGYINTKGEVVIDLLYDNASAFYEDTAIVTINNKYQLIDKQGKSLLSKGYTMLTRHDDNGMISYYDNSKWGLMDRSGKIITDALYDQIYGFQEGFAKVESNNRFGYINEKGITVVSLIYDDANHFSNGLAAVMVNDMWGYINPSGELVINHLYDYANSFDTFGHAVVGVSGNTSTQFGLINKQGNFVINLHDNVYGNGPIYAVQDDGNYFLYKKDGARFNQTTYSNIWSINEYVINVEFDNEDDMNVLFDKDGSIIARHDYYESDDTLVHTKKGYVQGLVIYNEDTIEIHIKGVIYHLDANEYYQSLPGELFIVERDSKFGVISHNGDIIVEFLYDALIKTDDEYIAFVINDKIGFMNHKFETILNATYDDVNISYNVSNW